MTAFEVMTGAADGAGSALHWVLEAAVGDEAVNELYLFELALRVPRADVEAQWPDGPERALLGRAARFRLGDAGYGVWRHGLVVSAQVDGVVLGDGVEWLRFRAGVAPRAWLLQFRRNSRVFTNRYVHEIVGAVLAEHGIRRSWHLAGAYPRRLYCLQYDESDWAFVRRLLAEEGIVFWFRHAEGFTPRVAPAPAGPMAPLREGFDLAGGAFGVASSVVPGRAGEALGVAATAAAMGADLVTPTGDDEDPRPLVPGAGAAGAEGAGEVFHFVDRAEGYDLALPDGQWGDALTLSVVTAEGMAGFSDHVRAFAFRRRLATERVETRDHDFRRPMMLLSASAAAPATDLAAPGNVPLEVYDHHGEYEYPDVADANARHHWDQHRAEAAVAEGRGHSARMLPGFVVGLENATALPAREGRYAVVRVAHEYRDRQVAATLPAHEPFDWLDDPRLDATTGRGAARRRRGHFLGDDEVYANRFECVPAGVAARPARPTRAPRTVTELATVVGPVGQDVYTDRHGRVRIQFHWDRENRWTEGASCWVRVVQPWAGPGWGAQFIPRVGMEVLVGFLAGDPDRPVVLGCLYDGTHATPEPLPQRATRSGVRTQTTPDGGGFNELSFDDTAGHERVYVHAQRDHETVVRRDRLSAVLHDDVATVSNEQRTGVGGAQHTAVGGDQSLLVGATRSSLVAGDQRSVVGRNDAARVEGHAQREVLGVEAAAVRRDAVRTVEGHESVAVHGSAVTTVGTGRPGEGAGAVTYVQGDAHVTARDRIALRTAPREADLARSSIRLECGRSVIELRDDAIILEAPTVIARATTAARLESGESRLVVRPEAAGLSGPYVAVVTTTTNSGLELSDGRARVGGATAVEITGARVAVSSAVDLPRLEYPRVAAAPTAEPNVEIQFFHPREGHDPEVPDAPLANVPWRAVAGGSTLEGTTGSDGVVRAHVPDGVAVLQVSLWAHLAFPERYPAARGPLSWTVRIVDEVPPADTAAGARLRLCNLGYAASTDLEAPSDPDPRLAAQPWRLDPQTREALRDFQLAWGLEPTGVYDDATQHRLKIIYGGGAPV